MKAKKPKTPEEIAEWAAKQVEWEQIPLADRILQIFEAMPTELGTPNERKILAVKLLPEYRTLSVSRLCQDAGITREAWYRIHKSPKFSDLCVQFIHAIKGTFMPEVFMAMVRGAIAGNTVSQIKLLEDTKLLRGQDENSATVNLNNWFVGNRNDDELQRQRNNVASVRGAATKRACFTVSDN